MALAAALWAIRGRGEPRTVLAFALGPVVFRGVLLALYNQVGLGSQADFGDLYELAGIEQTKIHFYQLAYIPPGLVTCLFLARPARARLPSLRGDRSSRPRPGRMAS